jgi:hypothetical protein
VVTRRGETEKVHGTGTEGAVDSEERREILAAASP